MAGREAFGGSRRPDAAAVAAVYANVWLYEREVLSEPLAMGLRGATVIWLVYRFRHQTGMGRAEHALGAGLGVLALSQSGFIVLGVLLVVPADPEPTRASTGAVGSCSEPSGATYLVLIAPWAIYGTQPGSEQAECRFHRTGPQPCARATARPLTAAACTATPSWAAPSSSPGRSRTTRGQPTASTAPWRFRVHRAIT